MYLLKLACVMLLLVGVLGCAGRRGAVARQWMAEMDATPAEEQVPHWTHIRSLMTREAPAVGDPAPDFDLETREGDRTVRLSSFREKVPVVLIFGSWT